MDHPTAVNQEQIEYWNSGAGDTWVAQQERLDRELDPLGRAALDALAPRAGEHVLDVGCGSGQTTFQLGDAVGPTGRVVGLDVSAQMLAAAAIGTVITGFSASARQQTNAMRPPGLSARSKFANAATGSAKNIVPKRE